MHKLLLTMLVFAATQIPIATTTYIQSTDILTSPEEVTFKSYYKDELLATKTGKEVAAKDLNLTEEKEYKVTTGNTEDKIHTVIVDDTKPDIKVTGVKDKQVCGSDTSIEIKIEDKNLDESKITLNDEEIKKDKIEITENGKYILKITAKDKAKNSAEETINFEVDKTLPLIDFEGYKENAKSLKLKVISNKEITGKCTVMKDGSLYTLKKDIFKEEESFEEEGEYTIKAEAEDRAGHTVSLTKKFIIDNTAPKVSIDVDDRSYHNKNVEPKYKVSENCKVTEYADGKEAKNPVFESEGTHTYKVEAIDAAGNKTVETINFVIDKTAPDIIVKGNDDYAKEINLSISSSEKIDYSLDITKDGAQFDTPSDLKFTEDGVYKAKITARDLAGNVSEKEISFVVDTVAPTIQINDIFDNACTNKNVTPNITVVDVNFKSKSVKAYKDDKEISYSFGNTLKNEGVYRLVVEAEDKAGNSSTKEISFIIDKTGPSMMYNMAKYVKSLNEIQMKSTDIHFKHAQIVAKGPSMIQAKGDNEVVLNDSRNNKVDSEKWTVTYSAEDNAGNKSEVIRHIIKDNVAPRTKITGVKNESFVNKAVTLKTEVVDANLQSSILRVYRGNALVGKGKSITVKKDGKYKAIFTAVDKAGNETVKEKSFVIDKKAPIVTLKSPKGNLKKPGKASVKSNEEGRAWMTVYRDGKTIISSVSEFDKFDRDGQYTIKAYAKDRAGNKAEVKTAKFIKDTVKPEISMSIANKAYYKNAKTAAFRVSERNYKDAKMIISGTTPGGRINRTIIPKGKFYSTNMTFSKNGKYDIEMTAVDKAGNRSHLRRTFVVDTTPPEITINAPKVVNKKNKLNVSVKISDDNFSAKEIYLTKGKDVKGYKDSFGSKGGTRTYNDIEKTKSNDGKYMLTVRATDKAGNVVTKTKSIIVNRFGSKFKVLSYSKDYGVPQDVQIKETNLSEIKDYECEVVRDGQSYPAEGVTTRKKAKETIYNIPSSNFVEDGVYTVRMTTKDKAGNTSRSAKDCKFKFTVDNTGPNINFAGVEEGGNYKDSSVRMYITAQDTLSSNANIAVSVEGRSMDVMEDGDQQYILVPSGYNQTITITATDEGGNQTVKEVKNVTVSNSKFSFFIIHKKLVMVVAIALILLAIGIILGVKTNKKTEDEEDDIEAI